VIFVKNEKANNKKSEETREGKRGRLYTKRSRDPIFYGISMSIKKKQNAKKEWQATRREIAEYLDPALARACLRKWRSKGREKERE